MKLVRRGSRNPTRRRGRKKIQWAWLVGGAALGAVGTTVYSLSQNTAGSVTMSNAAFGAGAGLALGGVVGGVVKKNGMTAALGALGGLGILGALYASSQAGA
jgi:hypothetical protein